MIDPADAIEALLDELKRQRAAGVTKVSVSPESLEFLRKVSGTAGPSAAVLVAVGGVLGGVHGMYAAFASRVREVGTLQAIGFSRAAIAISLVVESTVACLTGALLAAGAGGAGAGAVSVLGAAGAALRRMIRRHVDPESRTTEADLELLVDRTVA